MDSNVNDSSVAHPSDPSINEIFRSYAEEEITNGCIEAERVFVRLSNLEVLIDAINQQRPISPIQSDDDWDLEAESDGFDSSSDVEQIDIERETSIETYIRKMKREDEDGPEVCTICCSEFEVGEELRRLPCNHIFHKECVDKWLRRKSTCPLCRKRLEL